VRDPATHLVALLGLFLLLPAGGARLSARASQRQGWRLATRARSAPTRSSTSAGRARRRRALVGGAARVAPALGQLAAGAAG